MRKEKNMFVPGTKNQPEARVETMVVGMTFMCQLGPAEWCPSYVYRFAKPMPYRFMEEEAQKPANWLPPVFKKYGRGRGESRFVRLEHVDENKTTTQLVFYYHSGYPLDRQVTEFNQYVQSTMQALQEACGSTWDSDEWRPLTLETITSLDPATQSS